MGDIEHSPITYEQIADNLRLIYAHIYKHPDTAERMCEELREWVVRSSTIHLGAVAERDELRDMLTRVLYGDDDGSTGSERYMEAVALLDRLGGQ